MSATDRSTMHNGLTRLRDWDPRKMTWRTDALEERVCPICSHPGTAHFVRPDELTLHLCERCGTWFVSPAPNEAQLREFYQAYHHRHRVEAFRNTIFHEKHTAPSTADAPRLAARIREREPLDDFRIQELATMMRLDGARVLDVGCGTGQVLSALEALGANVLGIDVDEDAVSFVRDGLHHDEVRLDTIDSVEGAGTFDLVVLQDVIEHVFRPREILDRATELLAPSGLIYIWTPNATFARSDEQPLLFRADFEHIQFLQTRTITWLAHELDLEVLHVETIGYLISEQVDRGEGVNAPRAARRTSLRKKLWNIPGFHRLARLRRSVQVPQTSRAGNYHLFAVLRKS